MGLKWEDIQFEIIEIIDRWYEGYNKPDIPTVNYFKVKTDMVGIYLIKHEIEYDRWFTVM